MRLAEIATIRKQRVEPADSLAFIDGKPAIVLGAMVGDDQQIDRWSVELDNVIQEFRVELRNMKSPSNLLFSQRQHVDQRMQNLLQNLAFGAGAIVLVVLLLMGWRSMLVVGLALPFIGAAGHRRHAGSFHSNSPDVGDRINRCAGFAD